MAIVFSFPEITIPNHLCIYSFFDPTWVRPKAKVPLTRSGFFFLIWYSNFVVVLIVRFLFIHSNNHITSLICTASILTLTGRAVSQFTRVNWKMWIFFIWIKISLAFLLQSLQNYTHNSIQFNRYRLSVTKLCW